MRGKKNFLANCMLRSGMFHFLRFLSRDNCIVICYHRIRGEDDPETLFNRSVFGPTQEEFARQIKWLKENNDILSEEELFSVVNGEYSPPRRSVVITFDDGYIDSYTLAYPILKQFNVPAIFFVPSHVIEERSLGWWDIIVYLLKSTEKKEIDFMGESFALEKSFDDAENFFLGLIHQQKYEVGELLKKLVEICDVEPPDGLVQSKELTTWEQLREMSQNNMAIGSHTHTHLILSSLSADEQKFELEHSKKTIESNIGKKVRSISYPCGNYHDFTNTTKKIAGEAGYELAFSFLTGINSYGSLDSMDIKRIGDANYFPRFVSNVELPNIFCDNHNSIVSASGRY